MEIKVGQKVFLKPINNKARYGKKEIREEVILKVGRKYFFVGEEGSKQAFWTKFAIEDRKQVTNYSPDWQLYFSKQEILDEEESYRLYNKIRDKFQYYFNSGLTLEQLKQTDLIIFGDKGEISDGHHTFNELYYHRMTLFSILCNTYKDKAWKSWKHHDNTMFDDYFIVGVTTPEGDYTYHYHKDNWDMFKVEELEFAPNWDGHKPEDITRLLSLKSE